MENLYFLIYSNVNKRYIFLFPSRSTSNFTERQKINLLNNFIDTSFRTSLRGLVAKSIDSYTGLSPVWVRDTAGAQLRKPLSACGRLDWVFPGASAVPPVLNCLPHKSKIFLKRGKLIKMQCFRQPDPTSK